MEDIREVYNLTDAKLLLKDGYILFSTHVVSNTVLVYILVKHN